MMTPSKFGLIKKLIEAKWTGERIGEALGIGQTVISYVRNSDTLEDYKERINLHSNGGKKTKTVVVAPKQGSELNFKTSDFYLAVTFKSLGYNVVNQSHQTDGRVVFEFNVSAQNGEILTNKYYADQLTVSAYKFMNAINEFKTRIKSF